MFKALCGGMLTGLLLLLGPLAAGDGLRAPRPTAAQHDGDPSAESLDPFWLDGPADSGDGAGDPAADAHSREFSFENLGTAVPPPSDALSREFSFNNLDLSGGGASDAISREFSYVNLPPAAFAPVDAISRELTYFNIAPTAYQPADAITREFSFVNDRFIADILQDAVSREFSFFNQTPVSSFIFDAISREFSFYQPAPDLVPQIIGLPASGEVGQTVTISWQLHNNGDAPAGGPWVDRVYLSTDDVFGAEDTPLGSAVFAGDLPVGQTSETINLQITLPGTPADYFVLLVTDADDEVDEGEGEANNVAAAAIAVAPEPAPDLRVAAVLTPSSAVGGQQIVVEYMVENAGTAAAQANWLDAIYLSNDANLDGGDQLLRIGLANQAPLPPDGAYTVSRNVTLPLTFVEATVYIIVHTDQAGVVPDLDGGNNVLASDGIAVAATPAPDLVVTAVAAADTAEFGQEIPLGWMVANEGTAATSGGWSDYVYLSDNDTLSVDDRLLGTLSAPAGPLAPGDPAYEQFAAMPLPLDDQLPGGAYFVIIAADGGHSITEINELNNTGAYGPIAVSLPPLPNIVISEIQPPATVEVGVPATVEYTVMNAGAEPLSGSWVARVFASTDAAVGGDVLLANKVFDATLAPGETAAQSVEVAIPELNTPGVNFIICADVFGDVVEADESDNCTVAAESTYRLADLTVAPIVAPAAGVADGMLALTWTVHNNGDGAARPVWVDAVYLSNDATIGTDILLTTVPRTVATPAAGMYSANVNAVVPGYLEGLYYVVVETDRGTSVRESDEANNAVIAAAPTMITQPDRPNLVVSQVQASGAGLFGQPLTVDWTVTNAGPGAAGGVWVDRVFASTDMLLDAADLALGSAVRPQPLAPTESYVQQAVVESPPLPGDYYVLVVTDADNAVNEGLGGGEADNVGVADMTVAIGGYSVTADTDIDDAPAGTPVHISGTATRDDNGQPAVDVPVVVRITVRGFQRQLAAQTDENGDYAVTFEPGPTEGGRYEVTAGPGYAAGLPVQDEFRLWSLLAQPKNQDVYAVPGFMRTGSVLLKNLGELPQTGLTAGVEDAPAHVQVDVTLTDTVPGLGSIQVNYTLLATDNLPLVEPVRIVLTSAQGASTTANLNVTIGPAQATLIVAPEDLVGGQVRTTMLRGQRSFVSFRLRNVGAGDSGPISLVLPGVPWISSASLNPLPGIAAEGETAAVIQLDPPPDLVLGPYQGVIEVRYQDQVLGVPFRFEAVSSGIGDLLVRATDEFTYYAAGAPQVAGAMVRLYDANSAALVAGGQTGADGTLLLDGLQEAYYRLEVTAPQHGVFRTTTLVQGGRVNEIEAFMPRELISYNWSVVPTEVEDEYVIHIEAEFQTNVPAPVVVLEPSGLDLDALTLPAQVNFTITNYGLVTAENVTLDVLSNDLYELIPLVTEIGDLPGGCTPADPFGACRVTVPVLIVPGGGLRGAGCDPIGVRECHDLRCGANTYTYCSATRVYTRTCPPEPGTTPIVNTTAGPGGAPFTPPVGSLQPGPCDICFQPPKAAKCALAFAGCLEVPPWIPPVGNCGNDLLGAATPQAVSNAGVGCLGGAIGAAIDFGVGLICPECGIVSCLCTIARDCIPTCEDLSCIPCSLGDLYSVALQDAAGTLDCGLGLRENIADNPIYAYALHWYRGGAMLIALWVYPFDDVAWIEGNEPAVLANWLNQFQSASADASEDGPSISAAERTTLLATPYPSNLTPAQVQRFLDRWNRSLEYWADGILSADDLPPGADPDFIDAVLYQQVVDAVLAYMQEAEDAGFDTIEEAVQNARQVLQADRVDSGEGVCATVRIQIDQSLTLTRSAFRAMLEVENGSAGPLEGLFVELEIRDADGNPTTDRFVIGQPELVGVSDVDGTGLIPPGASASAAWLILPTDEAAPDAPRDYFVRGTMNYVVAGQVVTIPLFPVRITVLPNPRLELKYFLETVVYSDDPFTPQIEPAIPFSLGLLAHNTGAGTAKNLRITSSQPEIIDNDRGLIIDFDLIGAQVGLQPVAPSLTVNLGDLGPGLVGVARWLMICSLQGEFIGYSASFEHVSALNDPRLSLIESVDIFGLNHVVLADEPLSDGLPDFLSNDFPDLEDLPDRVHLSDATVAVVTPVLNMTVTPDLDTLTATLTGAMPDGWAYIRIDDPFAAQYRLSHVERADGKTLVANYNAWQTDRINRSVSGSPVERYVHLFDRFGPGEYTLHFDPDSSAPQALAWHSVADHGPEPLTAGLPIQPGVPATEPRLTGIRELVVTFNEPISAPTFAPVNVFVDGFDFAGAAIDLTGVAVTTELTQGNRVGIIRFAPALPDLGRYCIMLVGVRDGAGNLLTGDSARIDLTSLPGDATGDRRVNNTDAGAVGSLVGTDPVDPADANHVRSDVNGDGRIDLDDVFIVLDARGTDSRGTPNPCLLLEPAANSGADGQPSPRPKTGLSDPSVERRD